MAGLVLAADAPVGAGLPAMQALPMHGTGLAGDRRQAGSHKGRFDPSSNVCVSLR